MGISQVYNKRIFDRIFKATSLKHQKIKIFLDKMLKKLETKAN